MVNELKIDAVTTNPTIEAPILNHFQITELERLYIQLLIHDFLKINRSSLPSDIPCQDIADEEFALLKRAPSELQDIRAKAKANGAPINEVNRATVPTLLRKPADTEEIIQKTVRFYQIKDTREALEARLRLIASSALHSGSPKEKIWALGVPLRLLEEGDNDLDGLSRGLRFFLKERVSLDFPITDNGLIEQIFSIPIASRLIDQLLNEGPNTDSKLFWRAAALARWKDLSESSKKWFVSRGIVLIDAPLNIHLIHENESYFGPCHEVGAQVLSGTPDAISLDLSTNTLCRDAFSTHFPSVVHPNGIIAEANYFDRFRLSVSGYPVASSDSESRGIMMPYDIKSQVGIYLSTPRTFREGGNMYTQRAGSDNLVHIAMGRVAEFLRGEFMGRLI